MPKIIKHMSDMPYRDARGREYRYGEFWPVELSPFAYNETIAQEYFPLTKEKALEVGFCWRDTDKKKWDVSVLAKDLPDHIQDTPESIVGERIACLTCGRAYRVLKEEYDFLKKERLPFPRQCPDCRHKVRFENTKKRIVQTSLRHRMRQSVRRLCIANNAIKMRWYDMIDFIWWSVTL